VTHSFLLHDVETGEGIVIAMQEHYGRNMYQIQWKNLSLEGFASTQNKLRTAPLWGLRLRTLLMHDGESVTLRDAISRHLGEARQVTERFRKLKRNDQDALIEFLRSL
jgi:CxxC motif-containing protein (DUF1111 family)